MMRVSLTATTFDLEGALVLEPLPETDWGETTRRVSRVATLDGGAVINDFGSSIADRSIRLVWSLTGPDDEDAIRWIVETHQTLLLSCHLGALLVAPSSLKCAEGRATLALLVLEQLNA